MAIDLSTKHEPVTDLFPQPQSQTDWQKYRLSDVQVDQFHRDGFLPGIRISSVRL